ncbi:MAG: carbohydrate porin [Betaproteobacteria bacterium]|nr:carbohydrate porin [Betaproteobacteria bacterium]
MLRGLSSDRFENGGAAPIARRRWILAAATALSCVWGSLACAAPPPTSVPAGGTFHLAPGDCGQEILGGLSHSTNVLGSLCGLRPLLGRYAISIGLTETTEVLGNVSGGTRKGFAYDGLATLVLQMDTQRAFGWYGGTFDAAALHIQGRNLSTQNLQTLQTASGIEADRGTRLWELWYDQRFFRDDRLDLRVGQQSLDQEWMVSQDALSFVNTMFGWPMLPSADLPGGGPAYPLAAVGARLRARAHDAWTILAGIYNGSPVANNTGDPQLQNPHGTGFPLHGGTLAILEAQHAYPTLGTMLYGNASQPLARVYKVGVWYDSERFTDQAFDEEGLSLASPASNGIAKTHRGNWALYAVADQTIWQSAAEPDRTVAVFLRPMWTPLADRNEIDFSLNAGLAVHEPFLHRDDDTFALGLGYAHVSSHLVALDRQKGYPAHHAETIVEATYQYQATPWLQLQPDFQYVFHPGAGITTAQPVKNEAIVGLRANITF